jgi:hypothetical protein
VLPLDYILKSKKNLKFYFSGSFVDNGISVVMSLLFCVYSSKSVDNFENYDSHCERKAQKYKVVRKREEEPMILGWNSRYH